MRLETGHRDEKTIGLIEQAYALEPNEHNILDTVGWLRYKQGRMDDQGRLTDGPGGLSLIQNAADRTPVPNPEIFDHLGDALWRTGDSEGATTTWRRALKMVDEQEFEQGTINSLQLIQGRRWQLVVADPRHLYDRQFGGLFTRIRQKLVAAEEGHEPQIAPTFAEMDQR
jgi:hypothetical protein